MTEFQLVSDIHLEAYNVGTGILDLIEVDAENLILAGDICSQPHRLMDEISKVCKEYKNVLFIAGNHEYYHTSYENLNHELSLTETAIDNLFVFTEYRKILFEGIHIHGCTLWGNIVPAEEEANSKRINDYWYIMKDKQFLTPRVMTQMNVDQGRDLYHGIVQGEKNLVITHHAPSPIFIEPKYQLSPVNGSFYSNQDDTIKEKDIEMWCFGHTHARNDITVNNTRLLSNCYGYPNELNGYIDRTFTI